MTYNAIKAYIMWQDTAQFSTIIAVERRVYEAIEFAGRLPQFTKLLKNLSALRSWNSLMRPDTYKNLLASGIDEILTEEEREILKTPPVVGDLLDLYNTQGKTPLPWERN